MPMSRKFNGHIYHESSEHRLKSVALEHARRARRAGYQARVVRLADGWAVYTRR